MLRLFAIFLCLMCTSGCATSLDAILNRNVAENEVGEKGALSAIAMVADRRAVIVLPNGSYSSNMPHPVKFCAEPPPDTATSLKAQAMASLEAKAKAETAKVDGEGKLVIDDKLEKAVTVLAERTATLDMFRTGVYALCQYYLNGAMDAVQVGKSFELLIEAYKFSSTNGSKKP